MSQFNFLIAYYPGPKVLLPDTLSRLPGVKPLHESKKRFRNRFRTMIPKNKIESHLLQDLQNNDGKGDSLFTISYEIALIDAIHGANKENETAQKMIISLQDLLNQWWPISRKTDFSLLTMNIFYLEILRCSHSSRPAGYPGRVRTLDFLQRSYVWPRMTNFVAKFVKAYASAFGQRPLACHCPIF